MGIELFDEMTGEGLPEEGDYMDEAYETDTTAGIRHASLDIDAPGTDQGCAVSMEGFYENDQDREQSPSASRNPMYRNGGGSK